MAAGAGAKRSRRRATRPSARRVMRVDELVAHRVVERQRPTARTSRSGPRAGTPGGARQLVRERRARRRARRPGSVRRLARPIAPRFVAAHAPAGEDEIERVRMSDQPRQAHRAAVDQRHAPPPAEHAEHRVACGDAQVAPARELEPAGDRVAFDRGDHRLGEQHARRAHRAVAVRCTALPTPSPTAFRSAPAQNVPPAPVRIATS